MGKRRNGVCLQDLFGFIYSAVIVTFDDASFNSFYHTIHKHASKRPHGHC